MSFTVKIQKKLKKIERATKKLQDPQKIREIAGTKVLADMKIRTQKGLTVSGKVMAPYTEGYKKTREKNGLNTAPPDLRFTAKMMKRYHIESSPFKTVIVPERRDVEKAQGVIGKRPFTEITQQYENEVIKAVDRRLFS